MAWLPLYMRMATDRRDALAVLPTLPLDVQQHIMEHLPDSLPSLLDSRAVSSDLQRAFLTWPVGSTLRDMFVAALRNGGGWGRGSVMWRRLAMGGPQMWMQFAQHYASGEEVHTVLDLALGHQTDVYARAMMDMHPSLLTGDLLHVALRRGHTQMVIDLVDTRIPGLEMQYLLRCAAAEQSRLLVTKLWCLGASWTPETLQLLADEGSLLWVLSLEGFHREHIHGLLHRDNWDTVKRCITGSINRGHAAQLNRLLVLVQAWGYDRLHAASWARVLRDIMLSLDAPHLFSQLRITCWPESEVESAWRWLRSKDRPAAARALRLQAIELGVFPSSREEEEEE